MSSCLNSPERFKFVIAKFVSNSFKKFYIYLDSHGNMCHEQLELLFPFEIWIDADLLQKPYLLHEYAKSTASLQRELNSFPPSPPLSLSYTQPHILIAAVHISFNSCDHNSCSESNTGFHKYTSVFSFLSFNRSNCLLKIVL